MTDNAGTELTDSGSVRNKIHERESSILDVEARGDDEDTDNAEPLMRDFVSIKDIFQSAIIPNDMFIICFILISLEASLLGICYAFTSTDDVSHNGFAIIVACIYAAVATVNEGFDDLKTIVIGIKALGLSKKEKGDGALNRRRFVLGILQVANLSLLGFIMIMIVPLQGSPVDIILNSTAFLSIMRLDTYVLKYLGYTYVFDNDIAKYSAKVEALWMPRQKKLVILLTLITFGFMNTVANLAV